MVDGLPQGLAGTTDNVDLRKVRPIKLFLGGLTRNTTTKQLRDHFMQYGRVLDCVAMRQPDGRARGFGYVTLDSPGAADRCLAEPQVIDSRVIDVKRAVPGTLSASSPVGRGQTALSPMGLSNASNSPTSAAAMSPFMMPGSWDFASMGFPGSPPSPASMWASWAAAAASAARLAGGTAAATSPLMTESSCHATEALDCLAVLQSHSRGHLHRMAGTEETYLEPAPCSPPLTRGGRPRPAPLLTPSARDGEVCKLVADGPEFTGGTPQKIDFPLTTTGRSRTVLGDITPTAMVGSSPNPSQDPVKAPLPSPIGSNRKPLPSPATAGKVLPFAGKENAKDLAVPKRLLENKLSPVSPAGCFEIFDERQGDEDDTDASSVSSTPAQDNMAEASNGEGFDEHELPSVGSADHAGGMCKRCIFFSKGRCTNDRTCSFCHMAHIKRKPTRQEKRDRREAWLRKQQPPSTAQDRESEFPPGFSPQYGDVLPEAKRDWHDQLRQQQQGLPIQHTQLQPTGPSTAEISFPCSVSRALAMPPLVEEADEDDRSDIYDLLGGQKQSVATQTGEGILA